MKQERDGTYLLCYACLGVDYIILKRQMRPAAGSQQSQLSSKEILLHIPFRRLQVQYNIGSSKYVPSSPVSSLNPTAIHEDTYKSQPLG